MLYSFYLFLLINIYIHEMTHVLVCIIFKKKIMSVKLASDMISYKYKKIHIGINIFGKSYTKFIYKKKSLLFVSLNSILPTVSNVLFTLLIGRHVPLIDRNISLIILYYVLLNLVPIKFIKNDGYYLYKRLRNAYSSNRYNKVK